MIDLLQFGSPRLTDLIPAELLQELQESGRLMHYADNQVIQHRGDVKPGISLVATGAVRLGNIGTDGSFLTTSVLGPGQCFGEFTLFAGLPRTHDVSASGDCSIYQIPGARFRALFNRRRELAEALLTVSLVRNHELLEFFDDYRRLPLPARIAKLLLSISSSARKPDEIQCRQEDIAFTFGISRVSVGKVLKELQGLGLIELGYRRIRIPDIQGLDDWARGHNKLLSVEVKLNRQA